MFRRKDSRRQRSTVRKEKSNSVSPWLRRRLRFEPLEQRCLLTASLTQVTPFNSLSLGSGDSTLFAIGGPQAGNTGGANPIDGFDQIQVAQNATLGGVLDVMLVNNYVPAVGTTFDILCVGGTLSGKFADAQGLFSFPNGDRYFDVVSSGNGLQLQVKAAPGGLQYAPHDTASQDAFGEFLNNNYFDANETSFSYTGSLSVGGFAAFSGSLSFQQSSGQTLVAASGVTAQLGSASAGVQITGASFGLLLPGDGTYALEASGDAALTGISGFQLSGTLFAECNTTGAAVNQTISVDGNSATINVAVGAEEFAGTNLNLTVNNFANISGDISFDASGSDVVAVASNVSAAMTVGSFSAGVTGGTLGLVMNANDTVALEARGGLSLSGGGFASATAASALVRYNDTNTAYTNQSVTAGGVDYTFQNLPQATDLKVVSVTGLRARFADVFNVSGDFGFAENGSEMDAVAQNAEVTLGNASYTAGVTGGSLGLVIDANGKEALEASGGITLTGGGFASASATAVTARFNETGTQYTGNTVTAGDVS